MNPPPLSWTKATFHVPVRPPGESKIVPFPVAGIVAGPFGIFRGDTNGLDRGLTQPRFSLVLLACGRFLSTSARRIDCQVLAEELAPLEVAWTATDPTPSPGRGSRPHAGSSSAVSADTSFEPWGAGVLPAPIL
jgi:hypothetical protein